MTKSKDKNIKVFISEIIGHEIELDGFIKSLQFAFTRGADYIKFTNSSGATKVTAYREITYKESKQLEIDHLKKIIKKTELEINDLENEINRIPDEKI